MKYKGWHFWYFKSLSSASPASESMRARFGLTPFSMQLREIIIQLKSSVVLLKLREKQKCSDITNQQ